jgi:glycosyltransferase involved in cell wall biosynthesis
MATRILRWGEAAAVSLPSATMVVSRTLQQHYRNEHSSETIYVPNGATSAALRPPHQLLEWGLAPDAYVLFLGRFSPEKNCQLLIDAFEDLRAAGGLPPGMKLVLAGGSSHSDSYVSALRQHESEQIHFLPWVSGGDLEELLSNTALFVLPSSVEGMSLALLDAMAAGVCVLTSDIPENREVVESAGFTFHRGDRADLERMLELLISSPELRRQSAARGRECPAGVSLAGDRTLDRKSLLRRARLEFNREYAETGGGRTDSNSTCRGLNSTNQPKSVGSGQVADDNRYLRNSSLAERICIRGSDRA